jgi:hypothetical protein
MKRVNKNLCTHPKNKVAEYTDKSTNTFYSRCLKCTKTLYVRKFVRETIKEA